MQKPTDDSKNCQQIVLNSAELAYFDSGKSEKPVLLFIHGNSAALQAFAHQFDSSLARKYRIVAFDLPGHGLSTLHVGLSLTYALPTYAKILCEFLDALEIRAPLIVGHSLGGHIALEAAENIGGLAGLFVFGTPPVANNPPNLGEAFLPNPYLGLFFSGKPTWEDAQNAANQLFGDSIPEGSRVKEFAEYFTNTDPNARVQLAASVGELNLKDEIEIARALKVPFCLAHGRQERLINLKYIEDLQLRNLWRGQVQMIEEAGHLPQIETPQSFNLLLEEFAAYVWQGRPIYRSPEIHQPQPQPFTN